MGLGSYENRECAALARDLGVLHFRGENAATNLSRSQRKRLLTTPAGRAVRAAVNRKLSGGFAARPAPKSLISGVRRDGLKWQARNTKTCRSLGVFMSKDEAEAAVRREMGTSRVHLGEQNPRKKKQKMR